MWVHVLRVGSARSLLLGQLEPGPALGRVDKKVRENVNGTVSRVLKESNKTLKCLLFELGVRLHHVHAGLGDELKYLTIRLRRVSEALLEGLY